MSGRIERLYDMLQAEPLRRKRIITGSFAQGHMWMKQMCRRFGSVSNAAATTLEAWVLERMKLQLARAVKRYITPSEIKWVVCSLLVELQRRDVSGYLAKLTLTPGLTDALHRAVLELRMCGKRAEQIDPNDFGQPAKGLFLRELLANYEKWLEERRRIDWGGLAFETEGFDPPADESMLIVDPEVLHTLADRMLLGMLSAGRYRLLEPEDSFLHAAQFPYSELEMFHASGVLAEAREVLRRIVSSGVPLDQVEVIASDASNEAAFRTLCASQGLPCTFAEGWPLRKTRAGKAALFLLEWLESDFATAPLITALKQSVIQLSDGEHACASAERLVRELRQSGIGWGKERYARLGKLAAEAAAEGLDEERVGILLLLHRTFQRWLTPLDEAALSSPRAILQALLRILGQHAVMEDERDREAIASIRSLLQTMDAAGSCALHGELGLRYVREALEGIRVAADPSPLPGHLHVAPLSAGGMTGRPCTFLTGMSEHSWTSANRQDPVLPDDERERIHPELPLSRIVTARLTAARNSRLGMIRGRCTVSYSSYDMAEQKERMPAYEMLQLFRRRSGAAGADYHQLHEAMGEMVAYAASGSVYAIDQAEQWLRVMLGKHRTLRRGDKVLMRAYSHLGKGTEAMTARSGELASPYDGIIETNRHRMKMPGDAGSSSAFSASMLERYGRCPLQFFFQYQLGVQPEDEAVFDRTRWLHANQRGSLLHGIFDRYLKEGMDGEKAGQGSLDSLLEAADEAIMKYAERVPVPSDPVFRKERASLLQDVRIFFENERKRETKPVFAELRLHGDAPLQAQLEEGRTLPIRGFVDRVDELAPHRYKIYDYKTGSPGGYGGNACFSGGSMLQLPLYGLSVEQWMRNTGFDPDARVVESVYLFPTEKGMGEEVSRPQNRREDLAALLNAVTSGIREGLFPPAADPKQCTRCDYGGVCGSHAEQFAGKRLSSRNETRLRWTLEVSRYD